MLVTSPAEIAAAQRRRDMRRWLRQALPEELHASLLSMDEGGLAAMVRLSTPAPVPLQGGR